MATSTPGTLYVYGDSYSETSGSNRKTNGPIWSERVAKGWGLQLQSYAVIGSQACRVPDVNSPSIASQVEFYKKTVDPSKQGSDIKDVHAFFIGVTDIISSTKYQAANLVGCIRQQISDIHKADPKAQVLLLGIPPLEYSPFYSNNTKHAQVKKRVNEYNVELEDAVTDIGNDKAAASIPISFIDNNYLFADILGNPSGYGLEDVDNAYWNQCQGRCSDSMDTYLWWDSIHLTGAGHKAIADTVITKNPFDYSIIKDTSTTHYDNANDVNDGTTDVSGDTSFYSSDFYLHYASWILLGCVLLIIFIMIRPRYGLHLAMRTLGRRGKPHVYTAVPV
ncbi:unnamed protein product [Absidia cylindrospora]